MGKEEMPEEKAGDAGEVMMDKEGKQITPEEAKEQLADRKDNDGWRHEK